MLYVALGKTIQTIDAPFQLDVRIVPFEHAANNAKRRAELEPEQLLRQPAVTVGEYIVVAAAVPKLQHLSNILSIDASKIGENLFAEDQNPIFCIGLVGGLFVILFTVAYAAGSVLGKNHVFDPFDTGTQACALEIQGRIFNQAVGGVVAAQGLKV